MGTRAALATVVAIFGMIAVGCSGETEALPEMPKSAEPVPPAPTVETSPQPRRYGDGPKQTRSAIGGVFVKAPQQIEDMAIKHQLNIYKGQYGHFPRTNEEFHEKFMKGYGIRYPELEEGTEMVYDPEDQSVWIVPIESSDDDTTDNSETEQPAEPTDP